MPAGLLPFDSNIEIVANPKEFGRCFFLQQGQMKRFCELPQRVISILSSEMIKDVKARRIMYKMGIIDPMQQLEMYNYCNRGRVDDIPDLTLHGKMTTEYVQCGKHGKCPGEYIICKAAMINGIKITHREIECLRLIGSGKSYREIRMSMGFNSQASVNSLINRLKIKFNARGKTELALLACKTGIV